MTSEQKYQATAALLRELLRSTYDNRTRGCLLCGSVEHVGHMECPAEVIEAEYKKIQRAEWTV